MKTLWLIRHAKSSWNHGSITDIERPLSDRGYKDAGEMAERIKKHIVAPVLVSSPAIRAFSTAIIFSRHLGYDLSRIRISNLLYASGVDQYFSVIRRLEDEFQSALLFGHNPVISDVLNVTAGLQMDEMPTAAVAGIEYDIDSWKKLPLQTGKLTLFDFPKKK
ncbi:MAG TPA: histidine phosphatase family protein [Bacteroidia bacterium]|nr:histidine phosphatase family protein [Bacteroidia bacterium]